MEVTCSENKTIWKLAILWFLLVIVTLPHTITTCFQMWAPETIFFMVYIFVFSWSKYPRNFEIWLNSSCDLNTQMPTHAQKCERLGNFHMCFVLVSHIPIDLDGKGNEYSTFDQTIILGKDPATKSDEFLEKCQRGGEGRHFQSKNLYYRFWEL